MTPSTPTLEALPTASLGQATCGEGGAGRRHVLGQYAELGKLRLNAMVLVSTAVGFIMAAPADVRWGGLFWTLLGTGLAAVGAAAFNQLIEIRRDGLMDRTRHRPLPSRQMTRVAALIFGLLTVDLGVAVLYVLVNPLTAALGLLNVLVYVAAYTPLKPRTSLNTLVGAICGALPPMMGWAGAVGTLDLGAWLLGAILFIWQVPHFLALAWLYRADYSRAGHRMLPVVDPRGTLTGLAAVIYSLALLPLGLMLTLTGVAGWWFGLGSLVLGLGLCALAFRLSREKTPASARRLFLASVIYLPLLLGLMVCDARADRETGLVVAVQR